jgi:hypothetical protein
MFKIYFILLSTVVASCSLTRINYLGSSYAPTQKVDVFVDAAAVKRSFTVIGKSSVDIIRLTAANFEKLQERAVEKAKEKGANAILFQDLYLIENGSTTQTVSTSDSVGKSLVSVKTGVISPTVSSRKDILYLKYD